MESPILSQYTDFRKFLEDVYSYRRLNSSRIRPYSYSDFSAAANIKSPNYLKLIILGQRNLSLEMIQKFARALKLDKFQKKEFEALVLYGQAKEPLEKNKYLKALSELRAQKDLHSGHIDQETWDKIPNWLSWVLYAMIDQKDIKFEPETLQKVLKSRCSKKEISEALKKLTDSGDITIDADGTPHKTGKVISNVNKIPTALVRKLQEELIYLGLESLHTDAPTEREVGGFTFALTNEEVVWVRHELRKLRKDLQAKIMLEREAGKGDRVYQVNVQMYPLTEKSSQKESSESQSTRENDI